MSYMTDLKRAVGHGSAREGTERHWWMTKSSAGLLILLPFFIFTFGPMLGRPHAEVVAYFARPFPAIVAALMIVVGFMHFKNGIKMVIEDYSHGLTREILILVTTFLSYGAAATGVFAIAKIAL
ncbi:MAG: succinate dehydrogenase, hydrophobic membrane anchor protein [Silicimonas sp.]|nr:succinate dehydrogenase, hydrophobic membrane anchor protein [Silicimonas sp.]NNF91709.1 succinate dehydrogenase, hydrophobic membrane anchor protein [Boseongicola sp.]RZW06873.1 MAG: succinate dehydrogenase, hydrophobic membrane anchor protein [Paracoccaceae bacterium]MBT8424047.1 succinate dehydrogenase, hydrophobic membrane anchor protein [Silicimonas sp.]NND18458.1 succinate dehydrogenase, hydrophobic membrane anchor protein [Silicimonas sp.]